MTTNEESDHLSSVNNVNNYGVQGFEVRAEQKIKVVLCPDRDLPGVIHMEMISQYFPSAQWLYAFPDSPLWNNLPDSGGLDIVDWINELRNVYQLSDSQIKQIILNSLEDQPRTNSELRTQKYEVGTTKQELGTVNSEVTSQESGRDTAVPYSQKYEVGTQNYNHQSSINNHQQESNNHQSSINHHQSTVNNHQQESNNHQSLINHHQSTQNHVNNVNNGNGINQNGYQGTTTGNNQPNNQLLTEEVLIKELEKLIDLAPKESVLTTIFNKLGKLIGLPTAEIRKLYRDLSKEAEQKTELPYRQQEINELLELEADYLDLTRYLPVEMVLPLNLMAEILGSNSLSQLTALFSVIASLINPHTKLTLIQSSKFIARPIFYSAVVGESGSSKSPTMDIFTDPLIQYMQEKAENAYRKSLDNYNNYQGEKEQKPPKPKPLEYYVTDYTSECIASIINDQPNKGFLMLFDELSGLIKQNNAYRHGRGADQEKILSGRDGTGWKVNRKNGDRFNNPKSTYSILGAITPDILRQQMGNCEDESGYWARFCYSYLPLKKCKFPDDDVSIDIYPLLCSLYENIESQHPTHYRLCSLGKNIYKDFFNEMEENKIKEPNQAMRAVYCKFKRVAGEIALLLQCLHKAFYQNPDSEDSRNAILEPRFMTMGVELAKRYIKEIKAIYLRHESSNGHNLSPIYSKIISLSQRKGWLKARDLKQGDRYFRKLSTVDIRRHFQELISLGFGETKGKGKSLEWRFLEVRTQESELSRTQNFQLGTQNLEVRSQNSELRTQNLEVRSQKSEVRTQNFQLGTQNFQLGTQNSGELITNHQSTITNHQSSVNNHQSSVNNHQQGLTNQLATFPEIDSQKNVDKVDTIEELKTEVQSNTNNGFETFVDNLDPVDMVENLKAEIQNNTNNGFETFVDNLDPVDMVENLKAEIQNNTNNGFETFVDNLDPVDMVENLKAEIQSNTNNGFETFVDNLDPVDTVDKLTTEVHNNTSNGFQEFVVNVDKVGTEIESDLEDLEVHHNSVNNDKINEHQTIENVSPSRVEEIQEIGDVLLSTERETSHIEDISLSTGNINNSPTVDNINVNNLLGVEDSNVNNLSGVEDSNVNNLSGVEDSNVNNLSGVEDSNVNNLLGVEDSNVNNLSGVEDSNVNNLSGVEDSNVNNLLGVEDSNVNNLSGVEDSNVNNLSGVEDSTYAKLIV
jgi:CRISPR-associated protein Cmr3